MGIVLGSRRPAGQGCAPARRGSRGSPPLSLPGGSGQSPVPPQSSSPESTQSDVVAEMSQ